MGSHARRELGGGVMRRFSGCRTELAWRAAVCRLRCGQALGGDSHAAHKALMTNKLESMTACGHFADTWLKEVRVAERR